MPLTADEGDGESGGDAENADDQADERARARKEREARIAARVERQRAAQSRARRYRPGPPPGWEGAWREPPTPGVPESALDHEIDAIARAVADNESMTVRELHRAVGAQYWGPGEFRKALREALAENRIARKARGRVGPPSGMAEPGTPNR